jgi:potassium efflux system protein
MANVRSRSTARSLAFVLALLLLALAPAVGSAQEPQPRPPDETPQPGVGGPAKLTAEAIQEQRAIAEKAADLDEETRKAILANYDQALEQVSKANDWASRIALYEKGIAEAPGFLEEVKQELASPPGEPKPQVPEGASLDTIDQLRAAAEAELASARDELARLEAEKQNRSVRRIALPQDTAKARENLDQVRSDLRALAAADTATRLGSSRQTFLRSRMRALESELQAYEKELEYYDRRRDLLSARIDRWQRRVEARSKLVDAWRELVAERRREEADRAAEAARQALEEAARLHPVVKGIAEANKAFVDEAKELAARRNEVGDEKGKVETRMRDVEQRFDSVRSQVESVGLTEAVGTLLREQKARLPDLENRRRNIRLRRKEMGRVQVRTYELRQTLAEFDAEEGVREAMSGVEPDLPEAERLLIESEARSLLTKRRSPDGPLQELIGAYEGYLTDLVALDTIERKLIESVEDFRSFIDERVLWIRSTSPDRIFNPGRLLDAFRWLTSPANWAGVWETLAKDSVERPLLTGLAILVIIALGVLYRRARRRLLQVGETGDRKTSFKPTVNVLLLTILLSLLLPLFLWVTGWRLRAAIETTAFSRSVAGGLTAVAALWAMLNFVRWLCAPDGLAEGHFRWPSRGLKAVRRQLLWFIPVFLLAVFVVDTMEEQTVDPGWSDSLGCIAFLLCSGAFTVFLFRVFRPSGSVLEDVLKRRKAGWLQKSRYLWFPLVWGVPAALFVGAALGYYYTALQLVDRVIALWWLVIGLLVLHAMVIRWLLLARRRLAIEQARKRREEALARAKEEKAPGEEIEVPMETEHEIDFGTLDLQTRKLLQTFVVIALFAGVWWIWADVSPALRILENIRLTSPEAATQVALSDVALAVVIAVVTVIASRNVPGLLEVTLLQRLPLRAGEMYAITSISRYVIVIVGAVMTFGAIGIGWGKVQWLVAALSVGLGFGLQEIVANFVSGLILLVEQPIRVGDIVTVNTTSGRVSKIRMRATTIIDWDRREMVIPNKSFITGELVNWTLSDPTSRFVFPVGVAYGTDTGKVMETLMEVGRSCRYRMQDPEPHVLFKGFGESSLDFELRIFVPNRDNYVAIVNEMNAAIDAAFKREGIEIPFPQRDVHVRSIQDDLPLVRGRRPGRGADAPGGPEK